MADVTAGDVTELRGKKGNGVDAVGLGEYGPPTLLVG